MSIGRCAAALLILGVLVTGLAACGSGNGSDSSSTDAAASSVQSAKEHVSVEPAPYQRASANQAVLYRATQADPETVAALRKFLFAAADEIGAYWAAQLPQLYGQQYTSPRFVAGYDPANGAGVTCGGKPYALPGNAFFCVPDNYIAWDEPGLMIPLLKKGVLAPVFVIAHEWGHSVQHQLGVQFPNQIQYELNADCLAGAWARDAERRGKLSREDFDSAVEVLRKVQDPNGLPWTDPNAHGTAFERIDWFGKGADGGPYACITKATQPASGAPQA